MPTNTYNSYPPDNTLTTELHEWIQNDTFVYEGSPHDVDIVFLPWNKGMKTGPNNRVYTSEVRKKMSEIGKLCNTGEKNGFYGKTHSAKSIKLMSENKKGIKTGPRSEETKKRNSEAMKQRWADADSRKKLEKAQTNYLTQSRNSKGQFIKT